MEYVPQDQSVERWTDMLTVFIMARDTAPGIDSFFERMTTAFRVACEVEPIVEAPVRFRDGPYAAGTQAAICGKSKQHETANVVIYKMIEGMHGFYQVQRAWNFPATVNSKDVSFTAQMRADGERPLGDVHLCDRQKPAQTC